MTGLEKTGVFCTSTDEATPLRVHLNQVGVGFAYLVVESEPPLVSPL